MWLREKWCVSRCLTGRFWENAMRILVFSDTHGDADAISGVLAAVPCDLLLHLGDCTADCEEPRALFPGVTIWQVAGNDYRDTRSGIHYEDVFEAGGVRIFMTHGHRYHARSGPDMLCARAEAFGAALALYGHTHIAAAGRVGDVAYLNPGSASRSRCVNGRSYGVVTAENGKFTCEVVRF